MKNVEIERKYIVKESSIPKEYKKCFHSKIEQAFIYLKPAIRIRKVDDKYYLTVKSKPPIELGDVDDLARTEFEIEISKKAYIDLSKFCKGRIIKKTRYYIPYGNHTIELDIFDKDFKGLIYAEVEFKSVKEANKFKMPSWFYKDVTNIDKYKNTSLSICKNPENIVNSFHTDRL